MRCRDCEKQSEILRHLCEHGSDINHVNKIDCSPLYLATFYGCLNKVHTLLLYGADLNRYESSSISVRYCMVSKYKTDSENRAMQDTNAFMVFITCVLLQLDKFISLELVQERTVMDPRYM